MGSPLWKNVNFSAFWTSCFYTLERRFFTLEYRKRHFPDLYCLKKNRLKKWPFLDKNYGLTPSEKCQFFHFLNFLFLYLRKAFYLLEYRKRHFPGLYCLKRKGWKMAIFVKKPWANPFGKMSIFWPFELLDFIPYKGVFSF